jgi:chorismate--pyruvate lyase
LRQNKESFSGLKVFCQHNRIKFNPKGTIARKFRGDKKVKHLRSASVEAWLNDAGSFMKRLKHYRLEPELSVLKEGWIYPLKTEQAYLKVLPRHYVFIREVEISHQGQPFMFARTAIPAATLTGRERCLAHLGQRSLGSVLFSYAALEREPFDIQTCEFSRYSASPLWQRQSLFYLRKKPLLLTEVFLPPLIHFIESLK